MLSFLKHLFTPSTTNNYRAKILHPRILIFFILLFFAAGSLMPLVRSNYPQVLGISSDISTDQLLILTNQDRQQSGLSPLTLNDQLDQAAQAKGNDMIAKNYWAHIAPDGATPWMFIKGAGYNYVYAGENLARGYTTAADVINAWMASPEHRDNMLSSHYQNVGFAVVTGNLTGEDTVLVVEMFGSANLAATNPSTEQSITPTVESSPSANANAQSVKEATKNTTKTKEVLAKNPSAEIRPLVDAQTFSSNIAAITVTIFMFVLILDRVIIERKKILRFVGHNADHIIFFASILAIILILLKGHIV